MLKSIWSFSKKILLMIIGTHQKQFSQRCRKIFARGSKFLAHFWKRIAHTQFFQQSIFLSSFLVETYISVLATLPEVFWQNKKKIRPKSKIYEKYTFFSKKNVIEMILGTWRILFFLIGKFLLIVQKWQIVFLPANCPLNVSIETRNAVFSHLHKKSCRKAKIFSGQVPKKYRKCKKKIFKNYFSTKCSYVHVEYTSVNPIGKKVEKNPKFRWLRFQTL